MKSYVSCVLLIIFITLLISSCVFAPLQASNEIPFETISKSDSCHYQNKNTSIEVLSTLDDIQNIRSDLGENDPINKVLENMDYDKEFAIVVFNGYRLFANYDVTIHKVLRKEKEIEVYAEFVKPDLHSLVQPGSSSPYHIISVLKKGSWDEALTFSLFDENGNDNDVVAQTTHFIP